MSYTVQKTLPTVQQVHEKLPLSAKLEKKVAQDRSEIQDILAGRDDRKILIVGPCSAWPSEAVVEYFEKLKPLAEQVSDTLKIVARVYIQKPRTTLGWLGPVNQTDPFAEADIESGIMYCREMMLRVLELGFPVADEALFTHKKGFLTDLYSWMAIGARSTEDQEHRIYASMVDCPVGMKNSTSGHIGVAVNSIVAAQNSHIFVIDGQQIKTSGNPYAHLILRGGNKQSNYGAEKILKSAGLFEATKLENPSVIVDASHENSIDPETRKKDPLRQPEVISSVVESFQNPEIKKVVKGFMVESFLADGGQNVKNFSCASDMEYGKSITDPCLGIENTKAMIKQLKEQLQTFQ